MERALWALQELPTNDLQHTAGIHDAHKAGQGHLRTRRAQIPSLAVEVCASAATVFGSERASDSIITVTYNNREAGATWYKRGPFSTSQPLPMRKTAACSYR